MPYQHPDDIQNFSHLSSRPEPHDRLFRSDVIEETIDKISSQIEDEDIRKMFVQCFPNTLDTTVYHREREDRPDTFIVTGDIPAMWLRDSVNQVWPYLSFIDRDDEIKQLFLGLLYRHVLCVNSDPYANAFNREVDGDHIGVWERKWELDSLVSFFRLSCGYFEKTEDIKPFDDQWLQAVQKALEVMLLEQNTLDKDSRKFLFQFRTPGGHLHPAIRMEGYGYPSKRCGLVRSVFRPSDDECVFPYHIPANAMAVVQLRAVTKILKKIDADEASKLAESLADQIDTGIKEWGIVEHREFGKIYAYEVDGFGSSCIMDDPNIPSLLSLPYLGYCTADDEIYQNTRKMILSNWNSFFARGEIATGETSPHVGVIDHFWPMATVMQAITTDNEKEIATCLSTLKRTHAGTFYIHESVDVDNEHRFTRYWFAWVNSLFGELILNMFNTSPQILKQQF
ncbi:glycoside hydrolase family 125 protein [Candidatus Roizmanbacteria bacterium]|nr:glycoside hydrolase family 125 protein [Candidatus Roizmanbacteria bacterium]